MHPVIIIHGGAWAIPDHLVEASKSGVRCAALEGENVLNCGGSAVDAVEKAVRILEDDPAFDAGTGSVLTLDGEVEMDAVIMDGKTLNVGAVACVKNLRNPVSLARTLMEKSEHTMLVGPGANAYAKEMGFEETETEKLITEDARKEFEDILTFRKAINVEFRIRNSGSVTSGHDTVGAVALDSEGNIAFATSTGGITAKRPGRVGDSPLVGCGGYCDNEVGGVSTTGHGEAITKVCLAHRITSSMQQGLSAQSAAEEALNYMADRVHGSGGVIVIGRDGSLGKHFTTERMAWAHIQHGQLEYGINPDEIFTEKVLHS